MKAADMLPFFYSKAFQSSQNWKEITFHELSTDYPQTNRLSMHFSCYLCTVNIDRVLNSFSYD